MAKRFVSVPAEQIETFLQGKGFVRTVRFSEVVYVRAHEDKRYRVMVYTSIRVGASTARDVGQDAIRVCAVKDVGDGKTIGIAKLPRVYRTGSVEKVFERTLKRMRIAYARCTWHRAKGSSTRVDVKGAT